MKQLLNKLNHFSNIKIRRMIGVLLGKKIKGFCTAHVAEFLNNNLVFEENSIVDVPDLQSRKTYGIPVSKRLVKYNVWGTKFIKDDNNKLYLIENYDNHHLNILTDLINYECVMIKYDVIIPYHTKVSPDKVPGVHDIIKFMRNENEIKT